LIARRFNRDEPDRGADEPRRDDEAEDTGQFSLEETHERRILSWSPDPDDDFEDELVDADEDPAPLVDEVQEQARSAPTPEPTAAPVLQRAPEGYLPQPPTRPAARLPEPPPRDLDERVEQAAPAEPVTAANQNQQPSTGEEPRRRGRPRGRPRRQVHFHVDPDDELLLLAAAKMHGSQQKGLIAALQALQDNEVLREEIERLRTECERQRQLLADAEAIFNR
jgi:hypothetical protein